MLSLRSPTKFTGILSGLVLSGLVGLSEARADFSWFSRPHVPACGERLKRELFGKQNALVLHLKRFNLNFDNRFRVVTRLCPDQEICVGRLDVTEFDRKSENLVIQNTSLERLACQLADFARPDQSSLHFEIYERRSFLPIWSLIASQSLPLEALRFRQSYQIDLAEFSGTSLFIELR